MELRFHTILLVDDETLVAKYQNLVRSVFPKYSIEQGTLVDILPNGIRQQTQKRHVFSSTDGKCSLRVTAESLALELTAHTDRKDLLNKFTVGLNSFEQVWPAMNTTRFGIRYINQVNKTLIERDLNRVVTWSDLLHTDFLKMPAQMADLENTVFHCEINSVATAGRLVVRYGLLPNQNTGGPDVSFKFDCDRFIDGQIEKNDLTGLAEAFVEDIYQAYSGARGSMLIEWMELPNQSGDENARDN